MRDYLNIGSVPCDEDCAQVGTENYAIRGKAECKAFARQLIRTFGEPPAKAELRIKAFPHDFGTYYEVVCYYDDEDEKSSDYAFTLEGEMPCEWDDEAKKELGL